MHVVLFQPEIPPNTGSIARLCAATLTPLHLIEPLGFKIDDKHLKRAGLDYWEFVDLRVYKSWDHFLKESDGQKSSVLFQTREPRSFQSGSLSRTTTISSSVPRLEDCPRSLLDANPERSYRIPMMGSGVRSLNLSNAVSIVLYEGLRQLGKLD